MKRQKFLKYFTIFLSVLYIMTGCSRNGDNTSIDQNNNINTTASKIAKRWIVDKSKYSGKNIQQSIGKPVGSALGEGIANKSTRLSGNSIDLNNIQWIEFSPDGDYIIYDNNDNFSCGKYRISGSDTIILEDFGSVKLTSLSVDGTSLKFTLNFDKTKESKDLLGTAGQVFTLSNEYRDVILNKWSTLSNLEEAKGYSLFSSNVRKVDVLFTPYGTYLIKTFRDTGLPTYELNYWKPDNITKGKIFYKRSYMSDFSTIKYCLIKNVTSNSFTLEDHTGYIIINFNMTL